MRSGIHSREGGSHISADVPAKAAKRDRQKWRELRVNEGDTLSEANDRRELC